MGPWTVLVNAVCLLHSKVFDALIGNRLKLLESSLKTGLHVRTAGRTGASEPVCLALMVALLSCHREDVR